MKEYTLEELREDIDNLLSESIRYLNKGDIYRYYKTLAFAREFYLFFEEVEKLKLCDNLFEDGLEKRLINQKEKEKYEKYGKNKANFVIGVFLEGKEFLERKIIEASS